MKKTSKKAEDSLKYKAVYPPTIKKGDTIGVVTPAGPLISKRKFAAGIKLLEDQGFKVKFNRELLSSKGYLAGSDQERADDFNEMWANSEVKALVAARGGYGCLRMVDLVDMKQIRETPKILLGFSDITVLLNAIHKKTGLVTFHGPVITTIADSDRLSQKSFFDTLLGQTPAHLIPNSLKIIKGGTAQGILLGGNLTTLIHMIGTPYEFEWDNAILFIEDIGETAYRLDRFLTHLDRSNRLQKIQGLILGSFTDDNRKKNRAMQRAVHKRVAELLQKTDIPLWANFPVGHAKQNLSLPLGAEVEMASSENMLKFL